MINLPPVLVMCYWCKHQSRSGKIGCGCVLSVCVLHDLFILFIYWLNSAMILQAGVFGDQLSVEFTTLPTG